MPSALTPGSIDAILAPLADAPALLAVSGGPDSTALLVMAANWARRRERPRIEAATVDHGLRPEGADEAAAVGDLCRKLGVPHRTLLWRGDKPKTRLQERAREARYALLADHARAVGAEVVVTAHHLDDQAETVLFRLLRGSGMSGLAGMAARTTRDGLTLLRPLLSLAKTDLVAYCEAEGVAFARDPSNEDPRYARTRMRALLETLSAEGLDAAPALARLARRAARVEDALARQTAEAETRLRLIETGACHAADLWAEPTEIVQRLLTSTIAIIGGREASRIGLEKIEALAAGLRQAHESGERFSANVGGAWVRSDGNGAVRVEREPPRGQAGARGPDVPSPLAGEAVIAKQ
jgi:tRNA(Ile)-lysidine synthase